MTTRNFNVKNGLTVGTATIDATTGNANIGNLQVNGVSNLGPVGNVTITGGSSGYYLQTNGSGVLTWAAVPTGTGISNGTSNVNIPASGGNVNTSVAGNANVFVVTGTGVNVAGTSNVTGTSNTANLNVSGLSNLGAVGNVTITGGSSGFYLQTNGSGVLTWAAVPVGNGIANGTSNVLIPASGGNVNISSAGNANILVVTGTGVNVAGTLNATGNANFGNVGTNVAVITTGNITTINSGLMQNGNSNITITANGNISLSATGSPDELVVTATGVNVAGTLNATGNANVGNLGTARVIATGNISGTQLISNIATGTAPLVVTSTTQVANLNAATAGAATNAAAVQTNTSTSSTVYLAGVTSSSNGNSALNIVTGITANFASNTITATTFNGSLANGNSNVSIPAANGNVNISAVGNANVVVVTGTGANVSGTLNVTGNANTGNIGAATGVFTTAANTGLVQNGAANITIASGGAITINSGTNTNINLKPGGTGNIDANSTFITSVKNPVNLQDAATKAYVDTLVSTGISVHPAVAAATTTTLAATTGGTITYNNGASGVGANLVTTGSFNLIDTANVQTVGTRILVKNEANAAWNGVYTWANSTTIVRSTDTDSYGAADPDALGQNDLFFVTGGTVNLNTSWIVSTVGTITFGTTNITFSQFSATQDYTAGTGLTLSPNLEFSITNTAVTSGSYGNGDRVATFTVNGQGQLTAAANAVITANAANLTGTTLNSSIVTSSLTSVGTLGSLAVTGNVTAGNFVGIFANGNSSVAIPAANGNINLTAGGGTTELVVTATGVNVAGTLNATGNANVGNLGTAQVLATANVTAPQLISNTATGTAPFVVTSTTQVANLNVATAGTAGSATTAGTVTTNAQPNITSVGTLTGLTVGNATANTVFGNGTITSTGLANVGSLNVQGTSNLGAVGNITITGGSSGFYLQTNGSGVLTWAAVPSGNGIANGTSNITIPASGGNVNTSVAGNANVFVVTGTGVNVAGYANVTSLAVTGVSNLGPVGNVTITGGSSGQYLQTNGSGGLSWVSVPTATGIANGTSNVNIPASGGNVNTSVAGNANVFVVTGTGANIAGTLNATGNANVGNLGAAAGVFTANVTAGNVYANSGTIGASLLTGTLTTAAQPNVTSLGTLSSLTVSGNTTTGNLRLNGGLTSNRANVTVTTNTVIDQFAPATFRTAKYIISASGDFGYQSIETLLVHDGVDAYITIYGSISSNVSSEIVNLSANINGVSGNVSLYASNIGANVKINMVSSYIQI